MPARASISGNTKRKDNRMGLLYQPGVSYDTRTRPAEAAGRGFAGLIEISPY
jgi:hypothetical protein